MDSQDPRPSEIYRPISLDFSQTPFTVVWEVTRACDLRCVHCRADAESRRDPRELTTAEGKRLLEQVKELGSPIFVITGGDPLKREDLFELIEYGAELGLSIAVTPSGTPLLTREAVAQLKEAGIHRMALSLDGPTAEIHDAFRQQPGSFERTIAGAQYARELGIPLQINTTVTRRNLSYLNDIARVVGELGVAMWSCFFLVTVGRARAHDQLTPAEVEVVFSFLADLSERVSFGIRTTAAPAYRRFLSQRATAAKRSGQKNAAVPLWGRIQVNQPRPHQGVTDGNGFVFVSHTGDICPSGFLPIAAGNVRRSTLCEVYRNSPLFQRLHDADRLQGKCGICEYRHICGGSRARAFATTGNPFAEDPLCVHQPMHRAPL